MKKSLVAARTAETVDPQEKKGPAQTQQPVKRNIYWSAPLTQIICSTELLTVWVFSCQVELYVQEHGCWALTYTQPRNEPVTPSPTPISRNGAVQ